MLTDYYNWSRKLNERHYKKPYNRAFQKMIKSCERKNIFYNLTYEEFLEFVKIKNCHYCNKPIEWIAFGQKVSRYNLDRKDNTLGYTKNNCVVCCWECNNAKGNKFSYEDFYAISQILRINTEENNFFPNEFMLLNNIDFD